MLKTWNIYILTAILVLLCFFAPAKYKAVANTITDDFSFNISKIKIEGNVRPFNSSIEIEEINKSRYVVKIYLHAQVPSPPPSFSVIVNFPKENINQLWNSQAWSNKSYFTMPSYDRAAAGFSIISGLTINDQNQITFTCNDAYDSKFVSTHIQEHADTLQFGLDFFEDNPPVSDMQDYETQVLVDLRNIHFSKAIFEASKWRLADKFKTGVASVDTTKVPIFSTWYPMQRNIPLENITRELDSLSTFNFKSILIDDGWNSLVKMKVDTAYIYEEESYKTMQLFNQKRKDLGLKLFFWYSLPFMGGNPVVSQKFEGKYIHYKAPLQIYVLDPRYPDVRRHLISTYANFYRNWNFDGFWFDFMNRFYPSESSLISDDLGRDYVNISLALDNLLEHMTARLKGINPSIFMGNEFTPVGPDRANYQNFLSGFVGVNSTNTVREKMVNNRLLFGRLTPFMEIMGVHPRDKSTEVARKFQSIMYGNPYLSFFITTLPDDTKRTIRFWLNYWKQNYDVLLTGDFYPMKVARNYPAIKVESNDKIIYTIYEDYTLNLPMTLEKPMDVINAKESQLVNFVNSQAGLIYNYIIFDHQGISIENSELKTKKKNTTEFLIPEGGFIRFMTTN